MKNFSKFKLPLLIAIFSFVFYSCITIKSDYPEITYYELEQMPMKNIMYEPIDVNIQLRDIELNSSVDPESFIASWQDSRIQRYFYHRWQTNCGYMITDFLIRRINNYSCFKTGISKPKSILIPEYIIEAYVQSMKAHNNEDDDPGLNYVEMEIMFKVIKKDKKTFKSEVILSKVYKAKADRENYEAKTIAPAFSQALSKLSDEFIYDMISNIQDESN